MSLINSEVELIKKPVEEHKNFTSADGDDKNQLSQIDNQENDNDVAEDADAVVQEEAGV